MMRGKESWLLAALVGLLAWALYNRVPPRFLIPELFADLRAKWLASTAKAPSKNNSAVIHKSRALSSRHASSSIRASEFPRGVTTVVVPAPPFPTRENVLTGTALAQVRDTFGEPAMNVAELKEGHLLEHWYYINYDNTVMTVATMDNGVVSSVETLSKPNSGVHMIPGGG